MVVKIAALRHLPEERLEQQRLIADGREPARGCGLRRVAGGVGLKRRRIARRDAHERRHDQRVNRRAQE